MTNQPSSFSALSIIHAMAIVGKINVEYRPDGAKDPSNDLQTYCLLPEGAPHESALSIAELLNISLRAIEELHGNDADAASKAMTQAIMKGQTRKEQADDLN